MESASYVDMDTLVCDNFYTVYSNYFIFYFYYGMYNYEFKCFTPIQLIKSWNILPIVFKQSQLITTVPSFWQNISSIYFYSYQLQNLNFISGRAYNLSYSFYPKFMKKHCFIHRRYLPLRSISLNFNLPVIWLWIEGFRPHFQNFGRNIGIFLTQNLFDDTYECTNT